MAQHDTNPTHEHELPPLASGYYLSSILISTYSDEALASRWQWSLSLYLHLLLCLYIQFLRDMCTNSGLYRIYACIFNSLKIYAQVLYSLFLTSMGFVPTYSIPGGYVHKLCTFSSNLYRINARMFNFLEICAQVLYFLFWLLWDPCLYIQFPKNMCTSGLGVLTYEEVLGERSTKEDDFAKECVSDPWGSLLGNFDLRVSLWCVTYWEK